MQKGNVAGWRLEGEELYIFEPRAEIKCKYTQEVDPPASSGVPALSNDKDIPKLDPCKAYRLFQLRFKKKLEKIRVQGKQKLLLLKIKNLSPLQERLLLLNLKQHLM